MPPSTYLWKQLTVIVDRPLGSKHPNHGFEYKLNYGYIPDTMSWDGEELDAYVLDMPLPIGKCVWTCIGYIHRTNDDDDKLLVVMDDANVYTEEEIKALVDFQEKWFTSEIILIS